VIYSKSGPKETEPNENTIEKHLDSHHSATVITKDFLSWSLRHRNAATYPF